MTVSDWVTMAAAVVGAVVGGALALVGSLVVARREMLRATRVRLYELLTSSEDELSSDERRRELHRASLILSKRERKVAREIERLSEVRMPAVLDAAQE